MADLPPYPDLDQLRRQAKDLLRAARAGDPAATARLRAVSDRVTLATAHLALAREHGFPGWAALKAEVERRVVLDSLDVARLSALLAEHPEAATTRLSRWRDHRLGADPLGYLAMLRFDRGRPDLTGVGALARALIAAGAPVDGHPGDPETPLITAASYGDAEVARVLLDAGADVDAVSAPDSGGVPGGTALEHAAVFGMTEVVDVLVAAGARPDSLEMAAAAGDLAGWDPVRADRQSRLRALVFAADHERLDVLDALVAAGTPVNEPDARWGRLPLHVAAGNRRLASVRRLLRHGADPDLRDPVRHRTAVQWCGDDEVADLLRA